MLNAKHLVVLRAVAAQGSLRAAARVLSFTPSAVSQQMAALQHQTGVVLFVRTRRGVQLTDQGMTLLAHANIILDQLAEAEMSLDTGLRSHLRLGSFATATAAFVGAAVRDFRERYPGLELRVSDGDPDDSLVRLRAGELEAALVFDYEVRWPSGPHVRSLTDRRGRDRRELRIELIEDPLLLLVPADHALAFADRPHLHDLEGQRLLELASARWTSGVVEACRLAGFAPTFERRYRSPSLTSVQAFVAGALGLGLVPSMALDPLRDDLRAVALVGAPSRRVFLAYTPASPHREACESLGAHLQRVAAGWAARREGQCLAAGG